MKLVDGVRPRQLVQNAFVMHTHSLLTDEEQAIALLAALDQWVKKMGYTIQPVQSDGKSQE